MQDFSVSMFSSCLCHEKSVIPAELYPFMLSLNSWWFDGFVSHFKGFRSKYKEEKKSVINCWGITYLDLEDLRVNLIEEEKKESATPFEQQEPTGCISPPPPPPPPPHLFGPQSQAKSRGFFKNLILVGTIIMLLGYVRHIFRYLSSSSVTTGTLCQW